MSKNTTNKLTIFLIINTVICEWIIILGNLNNFGIVHIHF